MGTLYAYSPTGVQLWSTTNANLENSGMDWMGDNHFVVNGPTATSVFQLVNQQIFLQFTRGNRLSIDGIGVCVVPHQTPGEKDASNNFLQVYLTDYDTSTVAPNQVTFRSSMFDGGAFTDIWSDVPIFSASTHCGFCSDGMYFYFWRAANSIPAIIQFRKYLLNGTDLFSMGNVTSTNATVRDICFDGKDLWVIDGVSNLLRHFTTNFEELEGSFSIPSGVRGVMFAEGIFYIAGA